MPFFKGDYEQAPSRSSLESDFYYDDDLLAQEKTSESQRRSWLSTSVSNIAVKLLIACLITTIVAQTILLKQANARLRQQTITYNGLSLERTQTRELYKHSKYVSANETEADEAWDAILPGHGMVSIDPSYAKERNLNDSYLMNEKYGIPGKLMYGLEAYHGIHCVKVLRTHYVALDRGEDWGWLRPHDMHCFDALRQYIMCNIDDTLLSTTGHRDLGHGNMKKCHDWDALRDWAEERTANYFDVEPEFGIRHNNFYHKGDGLPIKSLS